ncbi:CDP-diacylglycerol--glycerol-3-phosphate 3-phosphatidyltransferase [Ureaplasma sp. ES3154-GEN]|uniref:CDP-diacylglycerol--glycerol-3-phosphate 3-phosphatidyltransferase n=1 Tax=Ureaplasma sp. ES3154-GEN TaxID=2984844 RepID=UPI0021E87FD3|nr:CDP-diacylglycerol--glycerol-3-phosphate 3-phosphatidyltransferase [Ureaplasma sp. ES3154-GEN]MCV3743587.1 CDP-diacylglycerol--glycerol-3-phosphate 3-phosphatidyltransferase [Ureaplasma sp. ES3154-GEN]
MAKSVFKPNRNKIIKHIPNIITFIRIAFALIAILFLLINIYLGWDLQFVSGGYTINIGSFATYISGLQIASGIIFLIAASTDWLDGYIARRYNVESTLGKIIDPIADKILINGVGLLLAFNNSVVAFLFVINLLRDILIDALRIYAASKKIPIHASKYGKIKTVLLIAGFSFSFFTIGINTNNNHWFVYVMNIINFVAVFFSIFSAVLYIKSFIKNKHQPTIN